MKKQKSLRISTRIFLTYFGLIFMFAFVAVFCYQTMTSNRDTSKYVSHVVDPSLKAMDDLELMIVESKMLTTNWVFLRSDIDDKQALKNLHNVRYPALKGRIDSLAFKWENKSASDSLDAILTDFEALIRIQKQITHKLVDFEDYDDPSLKFDAESTLEDLILPHTNNIINKLHSVKAIKKARKIALEDKVAQSTVNLRNFVSAILVIFIIMCIIMSIYMTNIITKPILRIRRAINTLGLGKLDEIETIGRNDEISEMITSVNTLVKNLKQTSEFANSIGKGNFKIEHTPLSDDDELGKALINMKTNLAKFSAEERDRNWLNQGINEVGELLRKDHDNPLNLSTKVLNYVVNYVNALQGAAYRVQTFNQNKIIELMATNGFSFNQKAKENLQPGEGFIGQCVVDKRTRTIATIDGVDPIYMGTNAITPKQILVLPMVIDEDVKAVFELSTLEPFSPLAIEFLNRVAGMMAATIDLIERKHTTESLLQEAQKLNTELSYKEEALRFANQKMEEKAHILEEQNEAIRTKNESLEIAREAIRVKADELERANLYKSEFLANMSHELRTPLNSILILSNLLVENKPANLNDKQVEYSKVIQKSGSDLLMLINDILDLSKIESKNMELDVEDINIADWANDINMLFAEVAKNKGIHFTVALDKSIPAILPSDSMRLSQVVKNLLSNAFKFTAANGVVSMRVYNAVATSKYNRDKVQGDALCIEIADTGIGIAPEKQQAIFEPFRQADGSTSRKFGGTGLGLSISRELSLLLGGEMTLESEPGKGSIFRLFVPLTNVQSIITPSLSSYKSIDTAVVEKTEVVFTPQLQQPEHAVTQGPLPDYNLAAYKLLLVDDDMRNIYSLTSILDDYKPNIVIATNGLEALEKLEEHTDIDLVLMDIMMPVMDGFEAMQKIRNEMNLKSLPIIAVTAKAMKGDGDKCKEAGASDYLPKPVSKEKLIQCIAHWLNINKAIAV